MCTLTIYTGKKRCIVTMNRDELRSRKEAGLLYSRSVGDLRLFYPVDISSGGTWFGVNNRGVVLALLNRYGGVEQPAARSRGEIIPRALEQGRYSAIEAWLLDMDAAEFNPFDLFLVSKSKVKHFTWDGEEWRVQKPGFRHWYMFTSSFMLEEEVTAFRQNFFQAWSLETGNTLENAEEVLRGYHLISIDGMESHSVLMERERSHTKSVIQADLDGSELIIKYIPEILEKSFAAPLADAQVESIQVLKKKAQDSGR